MSTMRSKHYQLIALALAGAQPDPAHDPLRYIQWVKDCYAVCDALALDNPDKFDKLKFIYLCGVSQ